MKKIARFYAQELGYLMLRGPIKPVGKKMKEL